MTPLDRAAVEALDVAGAWAVLDAQRHVLVELLNVQDDHRHLGDDCGDYVYAATDCWARLLACYQACDGAEGPFVEAVKAFLLEPATEWLGSDGDVRFELFTDAYVDASFAGELAPRGTRAEHDPSRWPHRPGSGETCPACATTHALPAEGLDP